MRVKLYPKTVRVGNPTYQVVEKLDGSNIGFFNLGGDLLIAQRNRAYLLSELEDKKDIMYRGLYDFLLENGKNLLSDLHRGSGFFGEWIGMGHIKYGDSLDRSLYIFAKANIKGVYGKHLEAENIVWNRNLLVYPFIDRVIPDFIGQPDLVATLEDVSVEMLDELYKQHLARVGRSVEGFIITDQSGSITKYVRKKDGRMGEHKLPRQL